jgi:hypothetical protein
LTVAPETPAQPELAAETAAAPPVHSPLNGSKYLVDALHPFMQHAKQFISRRDDDIVSIDVFVGELNAAAKAHAQAIGAAS